MSAPVLTDLFKAGDAGYACYMNPSAISFGSTVLAFAEARWTSCADFDCLGDVCGKHDFALRRSTDGGHTFGEISFPVTVEGAFHDVNDTLANIAPVRDASTGAVHLLFNRYPAWANTRKEFIHHPRAIQTFAIHSVDAGVSWSAPTNITQQLIDSGPAWTQYRNPGGVTPGPGIQLSSGALLVPGYGCAVAGDCVGYGENSTSRAWALRSVDGGRSWRMGADAVFAAAEPIAVELPNGTLLLNIRSLEWHHSGKSQPARRRLYATSHDGGLSWTDVPKGSMAPLPGPSCEAAFVRVGGLLLFSNPASDAIRVNMTLRISTSWARAWDSSTLVYPNSSWYSTIVGVPAAETPNGTDALLLFGRDCSSPIASASHGPAAHPSGVPLGHGGPLGRALGDGGPPGRGGLGHAECKSITSWRTPLPVAAAPAGEEAAARPASIRAARVDPSVRAAPALCADVRGLRAEVQSGADSAIRALLSPSGQSNCDYHHLLGRWFDYERLWHTGQMINGLVAAHSLTRDPAHLEAAVRAGDWWVAQRVGGGPSAGLINTSDVSRRSQPSWFTGRPTTSLTGITDGTPGLYRLSNATGDRKYGEVATESAAFLLARSQVPGAAGSYYGMVDLPTGTAVTPSSPWAPPAAVGVHAGPEIEGAINYDAYRFTGDGAFGDAFGAQCALAADTQDEYGLWMRYKPNDAKLGWVHPRFNVWYAHALLDCFRHSGNATFLRGAEATAARYALFQHDNGTLYYGNYVPSNRPEENAVCGSAVSALAMLWMRLLDEPSRGRATEALKPKLAMAMRWLRQNRWAAEHADRNVAGTFLEVSTRLDSKVRQSELALISRDLATSFGLQALVEYHGFCAKRAP